MGQHIIPSIHNHAVVGSSEHNMHDDREGNYSDPPRTTFPDTPDEKHASNAVLVFPLSDPLAPDTQRYKSFISNIAKPRKTEHTYHTNWLSKASERPILPFVVIHHCSNVRIGDTASRLASRSSGFFRDFRNDRRSRRLMTIVRLYD